MTGFYLGALADLGRELGKTRTVYAPIRRRHGLHWLVWDSDEDDLSLGSPTPLFSPKQFFFADRERLFVFDGQRFTETLPELAPQVLFGVPACDLTALRYQDRFFAQDPYYGRRRQATLLVGIDCAVPCAGGFCHAVDAGPRVRDGDADLVLQPVESGWVVRVGSEAGQRAMAELGLPPSAHHQSTSGAGLDAAHIQAGIARLQAGAVPRELWEELGLRCLGCSGCTTLCPTCSCFTVWDRGDGSAVCSRMRVWDSCLYAGFQRESSGHHPAATSGQRLERYFSHKFSRQTLETWGRYGCVGCGRCEITCPGVLGVHSVMRSLAAA